MSLLWGGNCLAQSVNINTDRPGQSDGVDVIPQNTFQIENGITLSKETFLNNLMLRYGLNRAVELRILIDAGKQESSRGLKPIAFSFKQKIIDKNKIVPAITLVGYASMGSLSSKDFRTNNVNTEWKLAFENTLSNMITFGYNIGTSENFKNFNLSVSNGYALSGKLSAFVEYFSTINKKEHNIDIGVLYLLNPNLQLDLAVGSPVFTHSNDFFGTLGVSYKFKKNKYIGGIPKSLKQSRNFN